MDNIAYLIENITEYGKLISICIEKDISVFRSYWDEREKGDRCYSIDWKGKRLYYSKRAYWESKGYTICKPIFAYDKFGTYHIAQKLEIDTNNTTQKNDATILDVACGGKMFYFDKQDERVLFCDIRNIETTLCDGRHFEVKPDIISDFTTLPFADNRFSMVVFDPPHLLHNTGKSKFADLYGSLNEKATPTGYQQIKYGALYSDWRDMLSKGFKECFRVLSPGGFLIFKWNETDIKVSEILDLTNERPVFGHKSGKQNKTHWICFMKKREKSKDQL